MSITGRANASWLWDRPTAGQGQANGSNTSVKTYLKMKEVTAQTQLHSKKKGVRVCERNNCIDTKVSEEGGGSAPGTRAGIPLQSMEDTPCWGTLLAGNCGTLARQVHAKVSLLAGIVTLWGTYTGAVCS